MTFVECFNFYWGWIGDLAGCILADIKYLKDLEKGIWKKIQICFIWSQENSAKNNVYKMKNVSG